MADKAVITKLSKSSEGAKLNLTLSFDDISTLANFGDGCETDLKYKKLTAADGSYLALVAHYPNYENSELKGGGYATVTYVVTSGGKKERVSLDKNTDEEQFSGDNQGVKITDADNLKSNRILRLLTNALQRLNQLLKNTATTNSTMTRRSKIIWQYISRNLTLLNLNSVTTALTPMKSC